MKKAILFLAVIAISLLSQAQTYRAMNDADATVAANYIVIVTNQRTVGSIQIFTNSAFDGTTSTTALEGSNDGGIVWSTVFEDDNVTPLSFTLSAGANSFVWIFKTIAFNKYRIVYTVGDATAGTINAYLNQQ